MSEGPSNKKTSVIEAAISVFSQKGFKNSTISDLAKKAGVGEATIYNHFKNKLEILHSIPELYVDDFVKSCDEQLRGIKNPEEKIRKYIWQLLQWSGQHKALIKVLLADIVPTPQFYKSEAYGKIKTVTHILHVFLDEGKKSGHFIKNIDNKMFTVFLSGSVAYLFTSRIMSGASFEPLDFFDELAGLITTAIRNSNNGSSEIDIHSIKNKKERILLAGEKLFSQKKSSETTIAEIAKTAKVADGTIYDYFKGKDELLFHIFNKRMKNFLDTYDEVFSPKKSETKLKLAVYHFLSWLQDNRAWSKVYIKDLATNPKFYQSPEYDYKKKHDKRLQKILSEGRDNGDFNNNITAEFFLAIYFGPIYFLSLPWALLNQEYSLIECMDNYYPLLLRAIKNNDGC